MNDFMDTVDPRIERGPIHRPVHMPTYYRRWGIALTLVILIVSMLMIWA